MQKKDLEFFFKHFSQREAAVGENYYVAEFINKFVSLRITIKT